MLELHNKLTNDQSNNSILLTVPVYVITAYQQTAAANGYIVSYTLDLTCVED